MSEVPFKMVPFDKTNFIDEVGYNYKTEVLQVKFSSGEMYRYRGVSNDVFDNFSLSPNSGVIFPKYIRDVYPSEKVIE